MPNPYLIIILLVAWITSLAGVGWWQNGAGHVSERVTWQTRENDQLRMVNDKIKTMEEAQRVKEQQHAQSVAVISTDYEGKLKNAQTQRDLDVAAARRGTLKLYDHSPRFSSCGSLPGQTTPGSGQRDGTAGSELPVESTEFLLIEANRADSIVAQLSACQSVIKADRE